MMCSRILVPAYVLAMTLALAAAGTAANRAFIWDSTTGMRGVPIHPNVYSYDAFSYATAVNNRGEVAGLREGTSFAEETKIGQRVYLPGTPAVATAIVCRGLSDINKYHPSNGQR